MGKDDDNIKIPGVRFPAPSEEQTGQIQPRTGNKNDVGTATPLFSQPRRHAMDASGSGSWTEEQRAAAAKAAEKAAKEAAKKAEKEAKEEKQEAKADRKAAKVARKQAREKARRGVDLVTEHRLVGGVKYALTGAATAMVVGSLAYAAARAAGEDHDTCVVIAIASGALTGAIAAGLAWVVED